MGPNLIFFFSSLFFIVSTVQMLDVLAGQRPQLTALEFALLSMTVVSAASGPLILNGALTEFLAPTAAACKLHRKRFNDS